MDESQAGGKPLHAAGRLTPARNPDDLLPWRRASQLDWCFLYWVPVRTFPIPAAQRQWLMAFFDRFGPIVAKELGLRPEVFFQLKLIYPSLLKPFLNNANEFQPLIGLSRRPNAPLPDAPKEEDIQAIVEGRKKYDFGEYVADYVYWFVDKAEKKQREVFFGEGGMTIIFLKPDPKTKPPVLPLSPALRAKNPLLQHFDIDRLAARAFALGDGFQKLSKDLFGAGLEQEPQSSGIRFILPLLSTQDFFTQPEEEKLKWFQLFDVYFSESPVDKGVLLASKPDLEEPIIELLRKMREEGLRYPEG
jgi:hypothetical protein